MTEYFLDLKVADLVCAECGRTGPGAYSITAVEIPDGVTTILSPERVLCGRCASAHRVTEKPASN